MVNMHKHYTVNLQMLKNHFLLILLLTISHGVILSQKDGYIISKTSKEKIAYATIYNISNQKGTLSNENGYFKIKKKDCNTLIIKPIGYIKEFRHSSAIL